MWAYSATRWLDAEHAVPAAVKVPLVGSLNRRRVNQLHRLYDRLSFLNAAKVQHRGGQGHRGTWLEKENLFIHVVVDSTEE